MWIFGDDDGNEEAIKYRPSDGDTLERKRVQAWFDRAISDPDGIRAWNTKFDRAFADQAGFNVPPDGKWHDGMLVAHALKEDRSVALKSVASGMFGEEAADNQKEVKDWLTKERARRKKAAQEAGEEIVEPNYSDVPDEIMEPYALYDVTLTRKICQQYDTILSQPTQEGLRKVIEFERATMDALYGIEKRGLPARQDEYRKLEQEVVQNLELLEEEVQRLAAEGDRAIFLKELGFDVEASEDGTIISVKGKAKVPDQSEFNPNSTPQILAALKSRGADMSFMSQKNGKISADAENLRTVEDPLAKAILEFRSEFKVLGTYVRPMIEKTHIKAMRMDKEPFIAPDSRIHANYRQVGARTGRMSCSDPNMQNQPRDDLRLRYNIVADPGFKIITCDLSNIEMVLFAAYCGPGRMLSAVQNGDDLHTLTAKMLGFRDRERSGGTYESARQQGKTYNFSRIYGGGLRTIQKQRRCTRDEAKLLKNRYDNAYPEVSRLQTKIEWALHDRGYVQDALISGRRFRVPIDESYKATNYLVQGTAASILKAAIQKLHADGVPMVALVHDEVVAHVPEDEAVEVRDLIVKRMTEFPQLDGVVPLSADGDIVDRWSDAKVLKEKESGREYYFDPKWANVPRRYVETTS